MALSVITTMCLIRTPRLKRYFAEGNQGDYLFLVDGAHNLVSRAREMFSACLVKEDILLVKKSIKGAPGSLRVSWSAATGICWS
ncbi:MAG: hypothetical protein ACLUD2_06760 [Clostridium sp.]